MYYQDPNGGFHHMPEPGFLFMLPPGSVEVSEEFVRNSTKQADGNPKGDAKAYLQNTDWYVIRKMETGANIPDDVLAARAEARRTLGMQ